MHWLMIGFVVSLAVLLVAVAGLARHILLQHAKHRREVLGRLDAGHESDLEMEP